MNPRLLLVSFLTGAAVLPALALENVTTINTTTVAGTASVSEGFTFENAVQSATSFSSATTNYIVASLANNVFVRRNTVSANNSSVWYVGGDPAASFAGQHQSTYDQMLLSNSVYLGTDNTFVNGNVSNTGNVERLDFTWNSARTASNSIRFGVFDRGLVGAHDAFSIAAITAVDGSGNPTAYGSLLSVAAGWGGSSNAFGDQFYHLFRYANGDNITASTASNEANTQGIGGILISSADLGLANGTAFYGYSLMSSDVSNPLNPSTFPTNTSADNGGGIDLAAINGLEIMAIPEPSTAVLSLAAGLVLLRVSRRRLAGW